MNAAFPRACPSGVKLAVDNRHARLALPIDEITEKLTAVFKQEGFVTVELSIAIIGHEEMHLLNRRFLAHDETTDVLSFRLDEPIDGVLSKSSLEGEIIVNADMAVERSTEFGWSADQELMYYLLHGTLHLCGYDDHGETQIAQMRAREDHYLKSWKLR